MDMVVMDMDTMETTSTDIMAMDGSIMDMGIIPIMAITTESNLLVIHTMETMEEA